jgi:fluoroacetyl-CoA thioesterase
MKPELRTGLTAEIEVTVTEDMLAEFDGEEMQHLYATSALVHHAELAARKLLIPYLEPQEQAMTSNIEVSHLMLTVPGMSVKVKAHLREIREKKIVCDIEATHVRGKVARGTLTQAIVEKAWLDNKVKEMSLINQLALQAEAAQRG